MYDVFYQRLRGALRNAGNMSKSGCGALESLASIRRADEKSPLISRAYAVYPGRNLLMAHFYFAIYPERILPLANFKFASYKV